MLPYYITYVPCTATKNAVAGYHRDIGYCYNDIKEDLVEQVEGILTAETQYFASLHKYTTRRNICVSTKKNNDNPF